MSQHLAIVLDGNIDLEGYYYDDHPPEEYVEVADWGPTIYKNKKLLLQLFDGIFKSNDFRFLTNQFNKDNDEKSINDVEFDLNELKIVISYQNPDGLTDGSRGTNHQMPLLILKDGKSVTSAEVVDLDLQKTMEALYPNGQPEFDVVVDGGLYFIRDKKEVEEHILENDNIDLVLYHS